MKKAQNVVEYLLIFMLVTIMGYMFFSKTDIKKLRNYMFNRPSTGSEITIEAMTK